MHGLKVEHRRLQNNQSITPDIARYIQRHSLYGKVAVVAENPRGFLSAIRKQWIRLERRVQIDRASTINTKRIGQLESTLRRMRKLKFKAEAPGFFLEADITIATANDFVQAAPDCKIVFVTYSFPIEQLHIITSWMPIDGRVFIYE